MEELLCIGQLLRVVKYKYKYTITFYHKKIGHGDLCLTLIKNGININAQDNAGILCFLCK